MTCCDTRMIGDETVGGNWRERLAALGRRIAGIPGILATRREVRRLEEFDDHQLRDIGLDRRDIRASLSCGFLDDPSGFLWQRRDRRDL